MNYRQGLASGFYNRANKWIYDRPYKWIQWRGLTFGFWDRVWQVDFMTRLDKWILWQGLTNGLYDMGWQIDSLAGVDKWILWQGMTSGFFDRSWQVESIIGASKWILLQGHGKLEMCEMGKIFLLNEWHPWWRHLFLFHRKWISDNSYQFYKSYIIFNKLLCHVRQLYRTS